MATVPTGPAIGNAFLSCGDLAPDQGVEILSRLDSVDSFEYRCDFRGQFVPNALVILGRELPALELEVQILDVTEDDVLLTLEQIPLGLFEDRRIRAVLSREQRPAHSRKDTAGEYSGN